MASLRVLARLLLLAVRKNRWEHVHSAADKFQPRARKVATKAFARAKAKIPQAALQLALKAGDVARVESIIEGALKEFDRAFRKSFIEVLTKVQGAAGTAAAEKLNAQLRVAAFNPDQPRDDSGKFAPSAGGGGSNEGSKSIPDGGYKLDKDGNDKDGNPGPQIAQKGEALWLYRGSGSDINDQLRADDVSEPEVRDALDDAMNPLDKETVVYRDFGEMNLEPGTEFHEKGYTSTASKSGTFNKGGRVKITLPKGTKVIKVGDYYEDDVENEIIVERDSQYEVISEKELRLIPKDKSRSLTVGSEQKFLIAGVATTTVLAGHLRVTAPKIKGFAFDKTNPQAKEWVDEHVGELIDEMSRVTRERVKDLVERTVDGEFDTHDLADKITELIGDESRAETIARTETMAASNGGQREAWAQAVDDGLLNGDEEEEWITTPDDKTCPICLPMDGEKKPLGGKFNVDGAQIDGPPAHPRCRCTTGLALKN